MVVNTKPCTVYSEMIDADVAGAACLFSFLLGFLFVLIAAK
nr:MAG TPA: protein of unknown function (DUF4094) [Caudoviricetes sp.]